MRPSELLLRLIVDSLSTFPVRQLQAERMLTPLFTCWLPWSTWAIKSVSLEIRTKRLIFRTTMIQLRTTHGIRKNTSIECTDQGLNNCNKTEDLRMQDLFYFPLPIQYIKLRCQTLWFFDFITSCVIWDGIRLPVRVWLATMVGGEFWGWSDDGLFNQTCFTSLLIIAWPLIASILSDLLLDIGREGVLALVCLWSLADQTIAMGQTKQR